MTVGAINLTGEWAGIYHYPRRAPPVTFRATLRDAGGRITGVTSEPGGKGGDAPREAFIEGVLTGLTLTFSKRYDDPDMHSHPILYEGHVSPDGDEIDGRWQIPGIWSGTFMMVRAPGATEAVQRHTRVPVDAR